MTDRERLEQYTVAAVPQAPLPIIEWAEKNVILPNSVRSARFDCSITPWLQEPLERATGSGTETVTLVKPVQSGGSVMGQILLLYWIVNPRGRFLQFNWSNDKRALEKWNSDIEPILTSCPLVQEKMARLPRFEGKKCEIDFGRVFFRMQGVFVPDNLDSDSVALQINEEIHSWEPGHLKKARGRQTAVSIAIRKAVDISNAGKKGDQLYEAFTAGTMQNWQVQCPGCNQFHSMRTHWENRHPEFGGLRYDSEGARLDNGRYDYNKIRSTVRFQMPCGYVVADDTMERRRLSLGGRFSEPTNAGAEAKHRSYTYEAVAVDYIDWVDLIKEKHEALYALRYGDPQPWRRYRTERECLFYDPEEMPISGGKIVINTAIKKKREGLGGNRLRLFALDRQRGENLKNEFPYWWMIIRDFVKDETGLHSLLVFEGKMETDDEVLNQLKVHECSPWQGVADSGNDTTHVYLFCLKNGINAIKGGKTVFYTHPDGSRKAYSPERPLASMLNRTTIYPLITIGKNQMPDPREPLFWLYSKSGIRERLYWLRKTTDYQTPGDVSEEYQLHQEAEERQARRQPRTGEEIVEYIQLKKRNDQYVNECYIAMQADMAGLIGDQK